MLSDEQRKLVEDNMNLVFYVIHRYNLSLNEQDLGFIGLCKAANTFDASKGLKFSTYAVRVIINEILYGLRSEKKYQDNTIPINTKVYPTEDASITIEDTVEDPLSIDGIMTLSELNKNVLEFISNLSEEDKIVYLGVIFYNKTQKEISRKLNLSQACISRRLNKLRKEFKDKYYKNISFDEIREEIYGKRDNC